MAVKRPKVGDAFSIPLGDGRVGCGQVVGMYGKDAYYFAVYDHVAINEDSLSIDDGLRSRVLFLALSLDAKLAAGHWTVIGQRPIPAAVRLPAYKEAVGSPENMEVVDSAGQRRRPASAIEAERLPNRKVIAPVRLEKALRAKHGLEPWIEAYTALAPDEQLTSERLFL